MREMEWSSMSFDNGCPSRRPLRLAFPVARNDGAPPRMQEREITDGGKISSADSGIETGNDSNDSTVAQMEINFVNELKKWFDDESMNNISDTEHRLSMIKNPSQTDSTSAQSVSTECTANCIDQPQSSLSFDTTDDTSALARNRALVLRGVPAKFNHTELLQQQYGDHKIRTIGRKMFTFMGPRRSDNIAKLFAIRTARLEQKMRIAAATNNIEELRSILKMGISPNTCDQQGRTPLHFASGRGYTEIVELLLKYRADAKRRDCIGNTPLHLAAVTSKISVVTLLLEAGADPLSLDDHGYNPLQLANTKLRLLKNCKSDEMMDAKSAIQSVVNMLSAYLRNRDGFGEQVEALSSICSRLTLSNTSDQLKNDVDDLLTNINYLQLNS